MTLAEVQAALKIKADGRWGMITATAVAKALKLAAFASIALAAPLSANFTLGEFTRSQTATARGLKNHPDAAQILNMVALCDSVLEPVRKQFGAVRITSGFRIWTADSQHGKGEAADFEVTGVSNVIVARWIVANLRFDQLILEAWSPNDPNAGWIHCSYRIDRARKSILRTPTGRAPYFTGLPN